MLFFQAAVLQSGDRGLSGSVALRIGTEPPAGPRQPEAVAVSPDGTRAWVVHEEDASISVIDSVNDVLLYDMPIGTPAESVGLPIEAAIDPDGRHLFVVDPRQSTITVLDVATDSVAGFIPVGTTCRGIAFDFSGPANRIYVTHETGGAVLVFTEQTPGRFDFTDILPLQGTGPGPVEVLGDGTLLVGHRISHDLEVIDPSVPGGSSLARIPLGPAIPWDLLVDGDRVLIPTFLVSTTGLSDGSNVVIEWNATTREVVDDGLFPNQATDYFFGALSEEYVAVVGSGSGSILLAARVTLDGLSVVDLAPGEPTTHPQAAAFVPNPGGSPEKLYVVNHFRETVRPVDVSSGAPYSLGAEIPLAHSGAPRIPLVDLDPMSTAEWFYATVEFFNGSAGHPNRVTCHTCHPFLFSSGLNHPETETGKQAPPPAAPWMTAPWPTQSRRWGACSDVCQRRDVTRVRGVATAAVREATNGRAFLDRVKAELDLNLEIIDGDTEASLSYRSVAHHFRLEDTEALIADIGGGSLELIGAVDGLVQWTDSLPFGAVRMTDLYFDDGQTSDGAQATPQENREESSGKYLPSTIPPATRLSAPAAPLPTSAAWLAARRGISLDEPVHGISVSTAEVEHLLDKLAAMAPDERAKVPGLNPSRADIIVAGLAVTAELLKRAKSRGLTVSAFGLREGLLLEMAGAETVSRLRRSHAAGRRVRRAVSCRPGARRASPCAGADVVRRPRGISRSGGG